MGNRGIFEKDYKAIIRNFKDFIFDGFYRDKKCIKLENQTSYHIYPIIQKNAIIYSGGVGKDISFELELIKKYDAKIFLFDPSPTGINTMKKIKNKNIKFYPLGLAEKPEKKYFKRPLDKEEGSFFISNNKKGDEFECTSISEMMKKNKHEKVDLLKLDIEGFEYGVLKDIFEKNIKINQIVLEFHGWMKGIPKKLDIKYKKLLRKKGYKLVYKRQNDYTWVKMEEREVNFVHKIFGALEIIYLNLLVKLQKLKQKIIYKSFFMPLKKIRINKPTFLIGVPGGGLTIIARILRKHPKIVYVSGNNTFFAGPDEMCNEKNIPKKLALWGTRGVYQLNKKDSFFGYETVWVTATKKLLKKFYLSEKDVKKKDIKETINLIKKYLRAYSKNIKTSRFLDKSQIFSLKTKFLNKIFPDAKFILVTRNPYAIIWRVASRDYSKSISKNLRELPLEKKVELASEHWKNTFKIALKDLKDLKKGLIIKSEDFAKNPEKELKKIMEYCELDGNPKELLPKPTDKFPIGSLNPEKWYPIKNDVNSKYLKELQKKCRDIITKTIGKPLLVKTGYWGAWKVKYIRD